ncbi:hypothetical protein [Cytophaga aurantiaca]|uniref:hypothetical protein n=1 Tax=Cytophaga aurantiaca TaxID=29530 RepID=UPI0003758095|nr:hypothetical protein [Cytophaga aurantiaca]
MKIILLPIFACTLLFSSAIFSDQRATEKQVPLKFYIEQNGIRQTITNNEVTLDKKTFNIVFVLKKPDGVLVSSSFNKITYEKALKKEALSKLPCYQNTGMAEGLFNKDNEVMISDEAPSYWFYDTDKEHRFNTIIKSRDSLVCTRTIKQVYIIDKQEPILIEKITKPLYFVFINLSDPNAHEPEEREMIKINWK